MKYISFVGIIFASFFVAVTAHAAIYMQYEGVKGETSATAELEIQATATTGTTRTQGSSATQVKTDDDNDGVQDDTPDGESSAKGKVEMEWKVEEGESMEEDSIDDSSDDDSDDDDDTRGMKGGVSVAAGDVDGLTEEEKIEFMMTVKEHAQVQSGQELENFAKGILLTDKNIEEVFEDEDEAGISYRSEGKLFGIIPVTYRQEVSVNTAGEEKGRVKVKLPWFSFLLKKEFSVTSDEVEAEAKKESGKDWIELESWSFAEKAEAFITISNVLKTRHDTAKNSINNVR